MKTVRYIILVCYAFIFIMGCAQDSAILKTQSAEQSKITQQELFNNFADYTIWLRATAVVFDPKDDDLKIVVGGKWATVKDQATWEQIVKDNTTSDGNVTPLWANYAMTGVREIRSRDNELFGYIIHQQRDLVSARVVDVNTMRVWHTTARVGGP
ncbi:MAG: hypothetical protein JSV38_03930 [Desulfobacterales bacterium]|nr:MAG: hypothetical protein JSV38_03930 [Desulfobacterales bacterium]